MRGYLKSTIQIPNNLTAQSGNGSGGGNGPRDGNGSGEGENLLFILLGSNGLNIEQAKYLKDAVQEWLIMRGEK